MASPMVPQTQLWSLDARLEVPVAVADGTTRVGEVPEEFAGGIVALCEVLVVVPDGLARQWECGLASELLLLRG
jgi:hypothetical protein